jgi:hypothetical protein
MRIFKSFFRWLCPGAAVVCLAFSGAAAGQPGKVVLQYHFAGVPALAQDPNLDSARKVFGLKTTAAFENLALARLSAAMAGSFHFQDGARTLDAVHYLIDNLTRVESAASVGGVAGRPLEFVLAARLTAEQAKAWEQDLKAINHGPGGPLPVAAYSGWQWNNGAGDTFWMVPAGGWLVAGRGESLAGVRLAYLQQIQKTGRPVAALAGDCFTADVDWPGLANWAPLSSCPLKLGRTQIVIKPEYGGFHMTCQVYYPEAIQWQAQSRIAPKNMVLEPLTSFTTGIDVEPFLKSDRTLASFPSNPLRSQFYCWSMGQMPFQYYVAWPESNPGGKMAALAAAATSALNPSLKALNGSELQWQPKGGQLIWSKLPIVAPTVFAAPKEDGEFMVAGLFPLTPGLRPAPAALWDQFMGRKDLVYYDWELTGRRLAPLMTLTQVTPLLQAFGIETGAAARGGDVAGRLKVERNWLVTLVPVLGNTVTEVTKTAANQVTVTRNSPLVFSSLELVMLAHVLSDTPSGPVDWSLLPQAKITGPGLPRH